MTGTELQETLENARLRSLEAVASLPDEALVAPGVDGERSIRDLMFLLTVWEAELVTGLAKIRQGKKPNRLLDVLANRQDFEALNLQKAAGRSLDRIFDDLQQVQIELEVWLSQFSGRELNDSRGFPWLNGKPLLSLVARASYGYEEAFAPALERFATRWLQSQHVGLSTIEVNTR